MRLDRFIQTQLPHIETKEELNIVMDSIARINKVGFGRKKIEYNQIIHLPFWTVKELLPSAFSEFNIYKVLHLINSKSDPVNQVEREMIDDEVLVTRYGGVRSYQAMGLFVSLMDDLKTVQLMEKDNLSVEPSKELKRANINKLNQVGNVATLMNLAKTINDSTENIKSMPYNQVYEYMLLHKIQNEINTSIANDR